MDIVDETTDGWKWLIWPQDTTSHVRDGWRMEEKVDRILSMLERAEAEQVYRDAGMKPPRDVRVVPGH